MNGLFLKKDGSEGFSVATRPYFHSTMRTHAMGRRGKGDGQVQWVGKGRGMDRCNG